MKLVSLALLMIAPTAFAPAAFAQTKVSSSNYGTAPDGSAVTSYTLKGAKVQVKIITWGAHVTSVMAPDKNGVQADVVLGHNSLAEYQTDDTFMGAIVGRYGNRIAKGQFTLDGKHYQLPVNDGANTLHGGTTGFDKKNWTGKPIPQGVEMTLVSPDGDQGFPGTLTAHVRYTLVGAALHIGYSMSTDKDTEINLTNHTYFNLAGKGDILAEKVMLNSDKITPVDAGLIPTGKYMDVAGTAFDFHTPTAIGERIGSKEEQMTLAAGYDHNYVLKGAGMKVAAVVTDPVSGRMLTVSTTEPGVQFYSGNHLNGSTKGRDGGVYGLHDGFCLETQHYPDSPNEPAFPTTELKAGQTYKSSTVFAFGVAK